MSLGTRMNAWLAYEVSAADAEALGAASDAAYVLVTEVEDLPLAAGTQFAFDVSAKETAGGGKFRRRLLVGNFTPHEH